jgi:hypothetical protein
MPNLLKDIELSEISHVFDGANPGARVVLFKNRTNPMKLSEQLKLKHRLEKFLGDLGPETVAKFQKEFGARDYSTAESMNEFNQKFWALIDSLNSIAMDDKIAADQKPLLMRASVDQFLADVKAETQEQKPPAANPNEDTMNEEQINKAVSDAVAKAVGTAVTDALAKQKTELETAHAAELAKSNERIAKLETDRENDALLAKARDMTDGVPGVTAIEAAELMKGMSDAQIAVLKKGWDAARTASSHLFRETGRNAAPGSVINKAAQDANAELEKAADDIQKANPNLSKQQAYRAAARQNREVYAKVRAGAN